MGGTDKITAKISLATQIIPWPILDITDADLCKNFWYFPISPSFFSADPQGRRGGFTCKISENELTTWKILLSVLLMLMHVTFDISYFRPPQVFMDRGRR